MDLVHYCVFHASFKRFLSVERLNEVEVVRFIMRSMLITHVRGLTI